MGVGLCVILMLGSVPLSDPALPVSSAPPEPPPLLVSEVVGACGGETAPEVLAPETVVAARRQQRGEQRRTLAARAARRPDEFWWTSSADVLRGVYGDCPPRVCCKFCSKGKPCGDTCISRYFTCRVKECGCACQRPIGDAAAP